VLNRTNVTYVFNVTPTYKVEIGFSGIGNGKPRNYAGLFASSAPTAVMLAWKYLDDTTDITNVNRNLTSGNVTFAGLTAPAYEIRFYNNDSNPNTPDELIKTISVAAPPYSLQRRTYASEGNVIVTRVPVGNRDEIRITPPNGAEERFTVDRGVEFNLHTVNDVPVAVPPVAP
jgi:hypothetical protein